MESWTSCCLWNMEGDQIWIWCDWSLVIQWLSFYQSDSAQSFTTTPNISPNRERRYGISDINIWNFHILISIYQYLCRYWYIDISKVKYLKQSYLWKFFWVKHSITNPIHPLQWSYRSFDRVGSSADQSSWFRTVKSRVQIPSSPKDVVF